MDLAATIYPLAPTTPLIETTPFCDKSCKGIRVWGEFVGRVVISLAYLVVSVVCWIFSRDLFEVYYSYAYHQCDMAFSITSAYMDYEEAVVNFSYNGCVITRAAETEEQALRARYGNQVIDELLQIGTDTIPLDRKKLERVRNGVCLGMSLDFAAHYLREINSGTKPAEAVRKVSGRYTAGAPDEAQLAQIFHEALDYRPELKEMNKASLAEFDIKLENVKQGAQTDILDLAAGNQTSDAKRLTDEVAEISSLIESVPLTNERGALNKRILLLAKQFGLKFDQLRVITQDSFEDGQFADFQGHLKDFPDECYTVSIGNQEVQHQIALIKSGSNFFLFDPNFATLALDIEKAAKELWKIAEELVDKTEGHAFSFSPCRLRTA